jgi:glycosyltransferase involved in cell wall biosynthesis
VKILHVNMSLDPVSGGGTAERTFQLNRALAIKGIANTVLTTDIGLTPERREAMEAAGVIVRALPCLQERFYLPRFSRREIMDIVGRVDVIHLVGHWTLINALVYLAAHRLGKPYAVCPAGALPLYGRSVILKKLYNLAIGRQIVRNAGGHIAITSDEAVQFSAYGIDREQVTVIPNGIGEDGFRRYDETAFRQRYGLASYPFILFMGRLNAIKGPDLLLQAFCALGDQRGEYRLVFAGPDEGMGSALRKIAAANQLDERVVFTGYLGGADKASAYRASSFLAVPSRQEAMSIVALEAGITGKPVLITDQCGFRGVAHCGGGIEVPATVEGLCDGMAAMMRNPDDLGNRGGKLQCYVSEYFTWDVISDKYIRLFTQLGRISGNSAV